MSRRWARSESRQSKSAQVEEVIAEDQAVDEAAVAAEEAEAQDEAAVEDAAVVEEEASGGAVEADTSEAAEETVAAAVDEAPAEAEVSAEDEAAAKDEVVMEAEASATSEPATVDGQGRVGQGQGRQGQGGGGSEMQARHMAPIPDEYAGLTDPIPADAESLTRGADHFELFCATCHGSEGLGDGPASAGLDPAPPMIAQTSLMTGDDYLFWRISEGGAFDPFNSAMPAWKEILDEQARWDTINYVRSLGGMNGDAGTVRAEMQATMQAEMLSAALDLGVIDPEEADLFSDVHERIDDYRLSLGDAATGNMEEMQDELLAGMVEAGQLSQTEADSFADIYARLDSAGVMQ